MDPRVSDEGHGERAVSLPIIKFGTDGWRAIIGEEFTFANVERVAQAYADILGPKAKKGPPLPLGFDRRFLSERFAERFAAVLAANGIPVLMSWTYCPTPCVSWTVKKTGAVGGVVITASHNPAPWNGIKFKEAPGISASPALTRRVEDRLQQGPGRPNAIGKALIERFDPFEDYVRQLRSRVDIAALRKSSWKIAFDPLYGSGAGFLERVLDLPVREIHGEDNPSFGGLNPEPIAQNLGALMDLVRSEAFDVGLATDGDADRIGAVDETGAFVNAGRIYALLLDHLLERGERGDVIKTVSTSQMVDRVAERHGVPVHETPIGFKHICAKFLEGSSLIGGEESGGIGFPSHVYERDGLLSALMILEMMSVRKKRLGALLKDLEEKIGPSVTIREDLHLPPDGIEKARDKIRDGKAERIGPLKVSRINRLDGLKYLLEDGSWLLLRPSGTEPLVRVYAEAADAGRARRLIAEGRRFLGAGDPF